MSYSYFWLYTNVSMPAAKRHATFDELPDEIKGVTALLLASRDAKGFGYLEGLGECYRSHDFPEAICFYVYRLPEL